MLLRGTGILFLLLFLSPFAFSYFDYNCHNQQDLCERAYVYEPTYSGMLNFPLDNANSKITNNAFHNIIEDFRNAIVRDGVILAFLICFFILFTPRVFVVCYKYLNQIFSKRGA